MLKISNFRITAVTALIAERNKDDPNEESSICKHISELQRPRNIKTHLSYEMLPKQVHEKNVKVRDKFSLEVLSLVCLSYNIQLFTTSRNEDTLPKLRCENIKLKIKMFYIHTYRIRR